MGRNPFVVLMLLYGICMFGLLVASIKGGHVVRTLILMLAASPVFGLFIWWRVQGAQPEVNWRQASAAGVIGDLVVLPAMMSLLALGCSRVDNQLDHTFWRSPSWYVTSYVLGLAGGVAFHFILGGRSDSHSANLAERLHDSPSAWAHDIGIFPALLGAAIFAILPLLVATTGTSRTLGWTALACGVVIWGGLSALDMFRLHWDVGNPWRFDPHWVEIDTKNLWR